MITISSNLIETTFRQTSPNLIFSESMEYTSNANQVAVIQTILLANALLFAYYLQTITINACSQGQAIAHCLQDRNMIVLHVEFVSITRPIISTAFCVTILIVDVYDASDVILIILIVSMFAIGCFMARINDPPSNSTTKADKYTLNSEKAQPVAVTQVVLQIALKMGVT